MTLEQWFAGIFIIVFLFSFATIAAYLWTLRKFLTCLRRDATNKWLELGSPQFGALEGTSNIGKALSYVLSGEYSTVPQAVGAVARIARWLFIAALSLVAILILVGVGIALVSRANH